MRGLSLSESLDTPLPFTTFLFLFFHSHSESFKYILGRVTRVTISGVKTNVVSYQRRLQLAQVNIKSNYWPTIFNYTMRSLIDWRLKEQTRSWNSQTELLRRRHARTFCTKLRSCSSDWSIVLFLSILFIAFVALRTSEIIDWHQLILFSSFLAIRVVFLKF